VGGEEGGVAVDRDDAEQVAPRSSQGAALQPARHLDRAERHQPGDLGLDVVRLDVEVVARFVVDCLYGSRTPEERPATR
jgi:hypothetical protein